MEKISISELFNACIKIGLIYFIIFCGMIGISVIYGLFTELYKSRNKIIVKTKKILSFSYIKNKGYRRICFLFGLFFGIMAFLINHYLIDKLLFTTLFFYLPFFISSIIKWIISGFKESRKINESHK